MGAGGLLSAKAPGISLTTGTVNLAVSPDGKSLYSSIYIVASIFQLDIDGTGLLSLKTPDSIATGLGTNPRAVAVTPDGKSAYVADDSNANVPQFDIDAGGLLSTKSPATVASAGSVADVAVTPDQPPVAKATVTTGTKAASFDASASTDSDGTIAKYEWNFGDGQTGSGAKLDHAYAKAGTYTATLTLTDDIGCSTQQVWQSQSAYCNGSSVATKSVQVEAGSTLTGLHVEPGFFRADANGKVLTSKRAPRGAELKFKLSSDSPVEFTIQKRIPGRRVGGRCVKPRKGNAGNRRCGRGFRKQDLELHRNRQGRPEQLAVLGAAVGWASSSWGVYRLKACRREERRQLSTALLVLQDRAPVA